MSPKIGHTGGARGVALLNNAYGLLLAGKAEEAAETASRAIAIADTPQGRALFVQALSLAQDAAALSRVRAAIARAIAQRWARPADLARIAAMVVMAGGAPEEKAARRDALLLALLTAAPVCTPELESYLTRMRRELLDAARGGARVDDAALTFYCALARQCFINEYAFACPEEEARIAEALAVALPGEPTPLRLAAVAAYGPLYRLKGADVLAAHKWPPALRALLVQQIEEPATERALRATIPRLTDVADAVSRAVQDQYEENPYPRWSETATVLATKPQTAFDALVAGCGTGRQSVELALRYPAARVLAVDLSLTSLSYAVRRTRELGVTNITYAQADILALGSIGRSFDLIESSGVLHHLADPWAGWRVLLQLLRPGGRMRIGLYSELARQPVVAAHAFIARHGYGRTAADIRRFRRDVVGESSLAMLAQSRDYYTISGCRDLLFHAQEHRMTLPQIKAFLDESGLVFEGFELGAATLSAYGRRFPGDAQMRDLDRWHAFEVDNPYTFVRMYQFVVRKP